MSTKATIDPTEEIRAAVRRNELGRLVRVEFVTVPVPRYFMRSQCGEIEIAATVREQRFVAFYFEDGLTPRVLRTYQPGRRD